MTRLRVTTKLAAPPDEVWADTAVITNHSEWMRDAIVVRFTSAQRQGVGTTFDCLTGYGPIRLTDRMEVTEWEPGEAMGVRHSGLVTGEGVFRLRPLRRLAARGSTWDEQLHFPWWLGGRVGSVLATPVMWWVWRRSLRALGRRFERS